MQAKALEPPIAHDMDFSSLKFGTDLKPETSWPYNELIAFAWVWVNRLAHQVTWLVDLISKGHSL
jgi:hypothetical protein